MTSTATGSTFETATLQRLQALGYRCQPGGNLDRPLHTVVLAELARLPATALPQAASDKQLFLVEFPQTRKR